MKTLQSSPTRQTLLHAGENLYRSKQSQIYYAIFKRDGKQVKRSLKTTDKELARRRLGELRQKVERLTSDSARALPFAEYDRDEQLCGGLAKRWIDAAGGAMEMSSRDRQLSVIRNLACHFRGVSMRNVTLRSLEQWATARRDGCSPRTFNYELETLRRILEYGMEHGILLENPARKIKRSRPHKKPITIPTREQFCEMVRVMRDNWANDSADFVELLAYSGCRKSEIAGDPKYGKPPMRWGDVNFEMKTFTVTRSKNHEARTVPLFPSMANFLLQLREKRPQPPKPSDPIITINSAKKALETASRRIGLPRMGHHSLRHFFCSNAIEAGIDFKVIAGWLGHKDGGVLVARTYGHLRDEHSTAMAKRMTFDVSTDSAEPVNVVKIAIAK